MLERPQSPNPYDLLPAVPGFVLESHDLTEGGELPNPHVSAWNGAGGDDVSPHLHWSGFPEETAGFAVTCFDPDAPTGSGFWHWAVANLPRSVTELPQGAGDPSGNKMPDGAVQLRNDGGQPGYMGAAPPKGDRPHRYIFAVHALGAAKLAVGPDAAPAILGFNITFNVLARATLTAIYQAR